MSKMINPITGLDYPDPDVIRVGNVYYMISTTMHFMPGGEILRSYDLVHWEHETYVYDTLDSTPAQKLTGEENIYGKGMWAATIRYHKGMFYVIFVANDTHKTYLYRAKDIKGPWEKSYIEGFYHDCSLLFDDDDEAYLVYGNRDIYLTQLNRDLTGPKEGGLHRLIISDKGNPMLGYEGAHFYKINGKYYVFLIHSLPDRWRRVEACFVADSLEGEFRGGDVLNDDRGYCGQGVAQGGIVDTPDGKWYAVLFQDSGAVGRIPVLLPVAWKEDFPVFGTDGKIPEIFPLADENPGYVYRPLTDSDNFKKENYGPNNTSSEIEKELYGCFGFKSCWQFNHEPDLEHVRGDWERGILRMENQKVCFCPTEAQNVLTQRMTYPGCSCEVTVDATGLKDGDFAGICAFQSCYSMVAVTRRDGNYYVVMQEKTPDSAFVEREAVLLGEEPGCLRLKVEVDFTKMKDTAKVFFEAEEGYRQIGPEHKLYFRLDHFTGCRVGLFSYGTVTLGGVAEFSDFIYTKHAKSD